MFETRNLYEKLADWWPLLSPAEEYAYEAGVYADILKKHCAGACEFLLELGSGGGSNAYQLKKYVKGMTLVDLSDGMLEVSNRLNPDCEHILGDMRNLWLDEEFYSVMIHDAISHMNTLEDLKSAVETAYLHTRIGGAALFTPDAVVETFTESTDTGGYDDTEYDRALRYLEWNVRDGQRDDIYHVYMSYLLRTGQQITYARDHWVMGLFSIAQWMEVLSSVGFTAFTHRAILDSSDNQEYVLFAGEKR
jgi:ubiquinone/menaquinone biosynthesis C-methylase UbiE